MTKKSAVNENYRHECDAKCVSELEKNVSPLFDGRFSSDELFAIFDFYLVNPPIKKDGNSADRNTRWIGDYGWKGLQLSVLEGNLLKKSKIPFFCLLSSDSIDETASQMSLKGDICPLHPRAVMQINSKISRREDGAYTCTKQETRIACLFRHIRNSLAHGLVFDLGNGNVYLKDENEAHKLTAAMVFSWQVLLEWIKAVDQKGNYYPSLFRNEKQKV